MCTVKFAHTQFTRYNQQTHNIFNTQWYLKTRTCFDASVHHLQGVILLRQSYMRVKINFNALRRRNM